MVVKGWRGRCVSRRSASQGHLCASKVAGLPPRLYSSQLLAQFHQLAQRFQGLAALTRNFMMDRFTAALDRGT